MPATATLTIEDDDGGLPTVEFSQSEYQFVENEGTVAVTVKLSAPAVEDVTVEFWVYPGSATEGEDYSAPAGGTLTFPAGETEQTIQATLVDDAEVEEAETIFFGLFDPVNALPGTILNATLFIIDNEQALPTVQFASDIFSVNENDGNDLPIKVTLSKASRAPVTVTCKSYDETATAPQDYYAVSTTIRFEPGETEKIVTIHIVNDAVVEGDESFTLELSAPSASATLGELAKAKVDILDDDGPGGPAEVELQPAPNQRGVTGDVVASTKGDTGEKHYVSPKKAGSSVILQGKMKPAGAKFEDHFEWEGGQAGDTPDTRKVSRDNSGKTEVKIKKKGLNDVVDRMNVWVVWANVQPTKTKDIKVKHVNTKPKIGPIQKGVWAESDWFFQANIEPSTLFDETADIPNLKGGKTKDVPGFNKDHIITGRKLAGGADNKWDISRRIRVRIKSPTVSTNDHNFPGGKIFDGLPTENKIQEDFPADEAEGNDDAGTIDEENKPYVPGGLNGKIFSFDEPRLPVFINAAGNNNDTYDLLSHFGEFVRLQIGDSNTAGYRNWYRVSVYQNWRHVAKLLKTGGSWGNNGSVADTTNDD